MNKGLQVGETHFHGLNEAHILQGLRFQAHRVIEELAMPVNTGNTVTLQHYFVCFLRIRAARLHVMSTVQLLIVIRRSTLQRKNGLPPIHHTVILREEAMATDIHTIPVVAHSTGNTAKLAGSFKDGDIILLRAIILKKFVSRSQASGTAADNYNGFFSHYEIILTCIKLVSTLYGNKLYYRVKTPFLTCVNRPFLEILPPDRAQITLLRNRASKL